MSSPIPSPDEHIEKLQEQLLVAKNRNSQHEAHIQLLLSQSDMSLKQEILIEQLSRAYCQLQNIYLAKMEPDAYKYEGDGLGEWLVCLEDAVGEDVYQVVLKKSQKLDDKKYGTKVGDCFVLYLTRS